MVTFSTRRPARRLWAAALLAAGLLAMPLAPRAHAAFAACRADPIVWVGVSSSNQYKLQFTATVGTSDATLIQRITYTVHIPVGQSLYSVSYTGGSLAGKETVKVVADSAANTFNVTTLVTTSAHTFSVTATEQVVHPSFTSGSPSNTVTGTDSQNIPNSVYLQ